MFVGSPGEALNAEITFNCIEEDGENYDYEKQGKPWNISKS